MTGAQLREVITYGPGRHEFRPADYPWLKRVRVSLQGGRGGSASDGTAGQPGKFVHHEYVVADLPPVVEMHVGHGSRGGYGGGQRGDDGLIIIELYEAKPPGLLRIYTDAVREAIRRYGAGWSASRPSGAGPGLATPQPRPGPPHPPMA